VKKNAAIQHAPFVRQVIELAKEKMMKGNGGPFAALIVKNGKVIAQGWNQVTTTNDPSAHAEVVAIRNACKKLNSFQLEDCIIYASCEPCPMCFGAIYWARPAAVVFAASAADAARAGFDDAFIYRELDAPLSKRKIAFSKIADSKSKEPFDLWLKKTDRVRY
jgi:guanine deaminase